MTFEVELKFPVADAADLSLQLIARGAVVGRAVRQTDLYLQHPSRDFRQTHEAFRIRRTDDSLFVTYKGPVIDARTKMRPEIEVPVGRTPADFDRLLSLFIALGFKPVRPVQKTRALYHLGWEGRDLEIAVDSVDGLGTYLEIESLAEEHDRNAARDAILRLAENLGLQNPERRSYLQLVLDREGEA